MSARACAAPDGLHLLADDLTGALDSAAAFAPGVPVYLDQPPQADLRGVVAVATESRDLPPDTLPARLAPLLAWFGSPGLAFKKVDSLLRGNTLHECAWLLREGGFDGLIFAPAFPAQRRVTQGGQHWLLPAPDSPVRGRTAIGQPLVTAFAQLGLAARVSPADDPPWGRLAARRRAPRAEEPRVWIPDAATDADLARLAQCACHPAVDGRWLWAGSAGLAQALSGVLGMRAAGSIGPGGESERPVRPAARTLVIGASHHPVVRGQWARLREQLAETTCGPAPIVVREGDPQALDDAWRSLGKPGEGIAALELSPAGVLTREQAAALLARQMADLLAHAVRPAQLLVLGGDSLLALCRAAGASSLRTAPARRAGWGSAWLVGGRWDGLRCHTRSGAFGDPDDIGAMLADVAAGN